MSEIRTTDIEARLREHCAPSALEVLDESAQHAGHAGADDSGIGTHFRGADCFTFVYRSVPRGAPPPCV